MKTQVALLAILATLAAATVTKANTADDVVLFVQQNKAANNIYGLYFLEKDENPIFSAITGLFSPDKERDFNTLINTNDTIKVQIVDVRKGDLKKVADQMRIPSFPFTIVYFSNDANDIVSGPADEDTAIKILEHRKPVATPPPPPPKPTPPPPKPTPPPPAPTTIRDLNRPIEEDDSWRNFKQTTHQYDWVDPINQYVFRPDFVPIAPEVVLPSGPFRPPVVEVARPPVVEVARPPVVEVSRPVERVVERPAPVVVERPVERVVERPAQVVVERPTAPIFNPWTAPVAPAAPVLATGPVRPAPVIAAGPRVGGPVVGPAPVVANKLRRP